MSTRGTRRAGFANLSGLQQIPPLPRNRIIDANSLVIRQYNIYQEKGGRTGGFRALNGSEERSLFLVEPDESKSNVFIQSSTCPSTGHLI